MQGCDGMVEVPMEGKDGKREKEGGRRGSRRKKKWKKEKDGGVEREREKGTGERGRKEKKISVRWPWIRSPIRHAHGNGKGREESLFGFDGWPKGRMTTKQFSRSFRWSLRDRPI